MITSLKKKNAHGISLASLALTGIWCRLICKTRCHRNGHHTLHLYSNYFSKDLKGFGSHYWIHPRYTLVKWRRGKAHSSHFTKEMPREDTWAGQGHVVSHLFAQNHVGTEISPKLSLYLLSFTYRLRKRRRFWFSALCLWLRPSNGQCPGWDTNWGREEVGKRWAFHFSFSGLLPAMFRWTDPWFLTIKRESSSCWN